MKKYFTIIVLLSLFVIGCSEKISIVEPENTTNSISEPNWIVKLDSDDLGVNTILTASELIDGKKGGDVQIRTSVPGGPKGEIKIDSRLTIHSDSFEGEMVISTSVDTEHFLTSFGPSYVFNKSLEYTLMLQGLDLSGIDPDKVKFVYQAADGSIQQCEYSSVDVDLNKGKLKVNSAQIPHFSRYGFIN
jgi:hypothetical protein